MAEHPIPSQDLASSDLANSLRSEGWAVTPPVIESALLDRLAADLASGAPKAGIRNLLHVCEPARTLARHPAVRQVAESIIGPRCFVTRAILFDKTPHANWKVPWHQDLAIAVLRRIDAPGFGPWSVKEGVPHVQPPAAVLAAMVTVRVHLDDCGLGNGPVRVLPRSHLEGKLAPADIERLKASTPEVACTVQRGGMLAFVPLLLHASSVSADPGHRRVAHFEFAAADLPGGMDWHLRWS